MEGVVDYPMRDLLTQINHYDLCITEFVRVSQTKVPKHLFYKIAPELKQGSVTSSGTPVRVQLLGQHPEWLAENAIIATELGSKGIDLNFGCPAKTVNKSKGGAVLLQEPEQLYKIISTTKAALTGLNQPLSVKIRLGYDDVSLLTEITQAIAESKPDMLTIHARTKRQGYNPPAYWQYIADIKSQLTMPIIANGEIWNRAQAIQCKEQATTEHLMLGRGALATPNLANIIKYNEAPYSWLQVCMVINRWLTSDTSDSSPYYFSSRLKQWLRYIKYMYPEAGTLFVAIKRLTTKDEILEVLKSSMLKAEKV